MTSGPGQVLSGLDASNPIGFLAAIGLLRLSREELGFAPRLSFRDGDWSAVLHDGPPVDEIARRVAADAPRWTGVAALQLSYAKGKPEAGDIRDLKPHPEWFRRWLVELVEAEDHRSLAFAAAYASELGRDNSDMTKPTVLHFTAGQQQFLASVREIAEAVTEADVLEALIGPWRYQRDVKTLSWDAAAARSYALRFGNPAKETRLGNPAVDWLAFHALPLLPAASRGSATLTACCGGGWKDGRFRWPIWSPPASLDAVRSLLVQPDLQSLDAGSRRSMGLIAVFASDITRSDQGGYGSFGPARLAHRDDFVGPDPRSRR